MESEQAQLQSQIQQLLEMVKELTDRRDTSEQRLLQIEMDIEWLKKRLAEAGDLRFE